MGVPLKTLVKRENQNIPHFIEKSISFIREYGVDAEGIFRHSGRATQIEKLRDQLDQGKKVFFSPGMDVHSVANLFKQWLRELPEPLLTWKLYDEFIAAYSLTNKNEKLKVLNSLLNEKLPQTNRYCFHHMLKLLREVIHNEAKTKLNASSLSVVFAPNVLVNGDSNATFSQHEFTAVNGIFEEILLNFDYLFADLGDVKESNEFTLSTPKKKRMKRSTSTKSVKLVERSPDTKNTRPPASPMTLARAAFREAAEKGKNAQGKEGDLLYQDKQRWVERYIIVKDNSLYRYKSATDRDKKTRTRIHISSIVRVTADPSLGKPFAFQLERKKDHNIVFACNSNEELQEWVSLFNH